ncbi:MAG: efflux RND transporter periplasmic adaptor subunit [Bacteroidia bacterium]|nr:efflux RND transporter periplasmic adaptor subunit [Bacteroidia bacterium]MCZ2248275.1 efflux RND transporter periplasmic adaptor subunit [Bacteroidia bacterium]
MKLKNIIIIIISIAALVIIKMTFFKPVKKTKPGGQFKPSAANVTGFITSGKELNNIQYVIGSIKANEEVKLIPETSGKLILINFKEGSQIAKGTLLAKVNDADLQSQLLKLKTQLKLAQDNESRLKKMLEIKGVSQEEYDTAKNLIETIEADIEYTKALIEKTEIKAPFDGKIGIRQVSEGSFVNNTTVIASIQQTHILKLDFTVPEIFVQNLKVGETIHFKVDNIDDTLNAKIEAIEPKIDEQTRSVSVRAIFNNSSNHTIFPGAFARVEVNINKHDKAILIPTEAIIPELKGKKVYINKSGKAIPVKVKTGIRNDAMIEITEGLQVGDTVIVSGIMTLKPESPIVITNIKK